MARGLWEKVEWIREQPEHIRMRYVLGCLLVSMIFIVGIWILSLNESLQNVSRTGPAPVENSRGVGSDSAPSLGDLRQDSAPLQTPAQDQETKTGQEYFEEQFVPKSGSQSPEMSPQPPAN